MFSMYGLGVDRGVKNLGPLSASVRRSARVMMKVFAAGRLRIVDR
jgi:hypothetical protein